VRKQFKVKPCKSILTGFFYAQKCAKKSNKTQFLGGFLVDLDFTIFSPPEADQKTLYCALLLGFISLQNELIKIILTPKIYYYEWT